MIQNLSLKEKKTESGLYRYIENQPFTYLQEKQFLNWLYIWPSEVLKWIIYMQWLWFYAVYIYYFSLMKNCKYSMYLRQTKVKIQIMLSRVVDGRGKITNNIRFLISSSVIHSPSIAKRAMYLSKISVNYIEP